MTDDALIEAMARAIADDDYVLNSDKTKAKAALAVARPIIEAPLRAENEKLRADLAEYIAQAERGHQTMVAEACELRKEIHKLRAALKAVCQGVISERESIDCAVIEGAALRAAAAALKETGDE